MKEIKEPTSRRIFALAEALRNGVSVEEIHRESYITTWFLDKMKNIVDLEKNIASKKMDEDLMRQAKKYGFSDRQLAIITKSDESKVRALRKKLKVFPVIKQIDTLAGEFPAQTNYLYMTYQGT